MSLDFTAMPVLVTGHTGFKGGWLSVWLSRLGAQVHGYALDPPTTPSFFDAARVGAILKSDTRADLADGAALKRAVELSQPKVVFHLAAQPLVRESYKDPLGTLETNVMGTARLLDACRGVGSVKAIVVITTDKVYEVHEGTQAYREGDVLGGRDPYSASKAAAEIVAACYRSSYFAASGDQSARIATARAGNVIGGGDWAADRLVPDCFRAFETGSEVFLRYPDAVRPWQHVLEPLAGYILLAGRLLQESGERYAKAWNFGPNGSDEATVFDVAKRTCRMMGDDTKVRISPSPSQAHETDQLRLDSTLARTELGWSPRWSLDEALSQSTAWNLAWLDKADMLEVSARQIDAYQMSQPA